jgi:hypothetical protein
MTYFRKTRQGNILEIDKENMVCRHIGGKETYWETLDALLNYYKHSALNSKWRPYVEDEEEDGVVINLSYE